MTRLSKLSPEIFSSMQGTKTTAIDRLQPVPRDLKEKGGGGGGRWGRSCLMTQIKETY